MTNMYHSWGFQEKCHFLPKIVEIMTQDNIGLFLTSPLGANFHPRGEVVPQGRILSPGGEIFCSSLHSSKQYVECSPLGVNEVVNIPPRVTPGDHRVKLRIASGWGKFCNCVQDLFQTYRNYGLFNNKKSNHFFLSTHLGGHYVLSDFRNSRTFLRNTSGHLVS
jgi:hypothetical protein